MHAFKRLFILYIISSVSVLSGNINSDKTNNGISLIDSRFQTGIINREEQLSQKLYYVFDREKLKTEYNTQADEPVKCATQIIREYESENFSLSKNNGSNIYYKSASINSVSSQQYISPSGIFELNYETSGTNGVPLYDNDSSGVPDYIEMVAGYCDYSWKFLVDSLGYRAPMVGKRKYQIAA